MAEKTQGSRKPAEYGSDLIVDLIKAYGIEYVAFNSGSSFRGIHDSLVNYGDNTRPEVIECTHEEVAVSLAHGYFKASGKPMVTIVHDSVGLQHASMAIYNAWCDRVPIIILGGNGPMDTRKRRPHSDWVHSSLIPANIVRDIVKWDDQPFSAASIPESFMRAYKVAMTPPRGPVFVCFDIDLQEQRLTQPVAIPDVSRYQPPAPIEPNPDALKQAAQWLVEAKAPVIVCDYMCRNKRAADAVVELAELMAIPVADNGHLRVNMSPNHPLNVIGAEDQFLKQADVVLAIDAADLFANLSIKDKETGLTRSILPPGCKVIQISLGELLIKSWSCEFGGLQAIDLNIAADSALAVPKLVELCRTLKGKEEARYRERYEKAKAAHDLLSAQWQGQAARQRDEVPIALSRLCGDIWQVIKDREWVIVNNKVRSWEQRLWQWQGPHQWTGFSGAGGLGYSLGAAMGGALAYRGSGKLCIDFESDGEFLYNASALWTAAHHKIPLLVVVFNNRSYYNSERHCQEVAKHRKRPEDRRVIGNRIEQPEVDFAKLVQGLGVYGEGPIEKPKDILPAIERAAKVITEKGVPALVDVISQYR